LSAWLKEFMGNLVLWQRLLMIAYILAVVGANIAFLTYQVRKVQTSQSNPETTIAYNHYDLFPKFEAWISISDYPCIGCGTCGNDTCQPYGTDCNPGFANRTFFANTSLNEFTRLSLVDYEWFDGFWHNTVLPFPVSLSSDDLVQVALDFTGIMTSCQTVSFSLVDTNDPNIAKPVSPPIPYQTDGRDFELPVLSNACRLKRGMAYFLSLSAQRFEPYDAPGYFEFKCSSTDYTPQPPDNLRLLFNGKNQYYTVLTVKQNPTYGPLDATSAFFAVLNICFTIFIFVFPNIAIAPHARFCCLDRLKIHRHGADGVRSMKRFSRTNQSLSTGVAAVMTPKSTPLQVSVVTIPQLTINTVQ